MKRIELFEFEDFHWLPVSIRSGITNLIKVFHRMIGTKEVLTNLLNKVREKIHFEQIVDMGSGSGGPMPEVVANLNSQNAANPVHLLLTDYHPGPEIVERINSRKIPNVQYHPASVDARNIASTPDGLKTMVASFHHMSPSVAKEILHAAQESGQPILIYELAKNNVPLLLWWLLLPISLPILFGMVWFMTPFVRPLSFSQIIFTYLIPIIPIIYAWDGQASLMRTYTFDDIESLLEKEDNYVWEIQDALKANGKTAGYYIFGYSG
ncbi:MAG: hypothetical protein GYB31_09475 [Bacteroidetes bacterium]|nr:hypothetical protein [Bacteroidota bacterium]